MNQELSMNANQLVAFLQKPASEFTKADIISFIRQNGVAKRWTALWRHQPL